MRIRNVIIVVAFAMAAMPLLAAGETDKADHGGWGGHSGHHGGHYDMIQHGDHYHAVYHQPSHGHYHGWGRKLMGVDSAQKVDSAQHGGWGNYGGYGGWGNNYHSHNSGHWDMVPHGNHYDAVWHNTGGYGGWGGWGKK